MDAPSYFRCRLTVDARCALPLLLFSFLLAVVGPASARVLLVPQEYPTITEGANAAVAGDTVFVRHPNPPEYAYRNEVIEIKPGVSVIADRDTTVVWKVPIEDSWITFTAGSETARLEWFSITAPLFRNGVVTHNPQCEIRDNKIRVNGPESFPGVLSYDGGLIDHNEFFHVGAYTTWGIVIFEGEAVIRRNAFNVDVLPGIVVVNDGAPSPAHVEIWNNNWAVVDLQWQGDATVEIVNNIIAGLFECNGRESIRYNDFRYGYPEPPCVLGPGNLLQVDPMFCGLPGIEDYLHAESPLAHAGEGGTFIGRHGIGCGITSVNNEDAPSRHPHFAIDPNPVRSGATFTFDRAIGSRVALEIYDPNGRLIDLLRPTGQSATWLPGNEARSGVYFARLRGIGGARVVKFLVVR